MSYTFLFTKEAKKDIEKLDNIIKKRLYKKILEVAQAENIIPIARPLINAEAGTYRLRIGDYRLIFDLLEEDKIIVLRVRHRKEVYR